VLSVVNLEPVHKRLRTISRKIDPSTLIRKMYILPIVHKFDVTTQYIHKKSVPCSRWRLWWSQSKADEYYSSDVPASLGPGEEGGAINTTSRGVDEKSGSRFIWDDVFLSTKTVKQQSRAAKIAFTVVGSHLQLMRIFRSSSSSLQNYPPPP